jgi:hypothetical protein
MGAEVITFIAISGNSATSSIDSVTNALSIAIIGVEASGLIGTMIGFGWGAVPDTPETWTAQSDTSEDWTPVTDTSESWSPVSDTSEDWSEISDNSETWTQVPA